VVLCVCVCVCVYVRVVCNIAYVVCNTCMYAILQYVCVSGYYVCLYVLCDQ
jgi:hypothetical protein